MNPFQIIATLRKFGNFLVGLFPWLGKLAEFVSGRFVRLLALLMAVGFIGATFKYLNERAWVKGIKSVFKRFYWRDYSKDRLSLDDLPADSVVILRPVFLVSSFLCLLMPALMLPGGSVAVENFSGLKSDVPMWSVLLWFASAVIAWAALLVGSAAANRFAFLLCGVAYSYLCGPVVACAPKSPTNVLIPLTIVFAIFVHEKCCASSGKWNAIFGAIVSMILGAASGIFFFAATTIKMPPEISSLWISLPLGALLGLGAFAAARASAGENSPMPKLLKAEVPLSLAFRVVALMLALNLIVLCFRAGLSKAAGHLISLTHLTASYAWPVWYLLAVGIIIKLIKNSDVVAKATADVVGAKFLRPATVAVIAASTAVVYCENALKCFLPGSPFYFISDAAVHVYSWSRSWFWREPIFAISAPYIGPVLIFDLICMIWLIAQKRFTDSAAGRFLYLTILAWFVISEYTFEVLSLGRSPSHSIFALMFFSIWLLWLMHTIGLGLSSRSSPLWPAKSRLPIYGGILIFALLEIHSRGAMHDFKVTNELFLTMERGIIDVGLPYFLWVYVSRRFTQLPIGVAAVFCIFCAGALLALPLNLLDKMAVSNWNWSSFLTLNELLTQKYVTTGDFQYGGALHWGWLTVRTLLYCLMLAAAGVLTWRWGRKKPMTSMIVTFVLVTMASGIASFSKGFLDLGLPAAFAVATAPLTLELVLSQRVLTIYLAAWIPALLLCLALPKETSSAAQLETEQTESVKPIAPVSAGRLTVFLLIGFLLSAVLTVLFYCFEDFLQASDAMVALLSLYGVVFLFLVSKLVEGASLDNEQAKNRRDLRALGLVFASGAAAWFGVNVFSGITNLRPVASVGKDLRLPVEFSSPVNANSDKSKATIYTNAKSSTDKTYFVIGKVSSGGLAVNALLASIVDKAAKSGQYDDLKVASVENWQTRCPGALACVFTYNIVLSVGASGPIKVPMNGITVLLPGADPQWMNFVTVYTPPAEVTLRRWQAAWLVDQLASTK